MTGLRISRLARSQTPLFTPPKRYTLGVGPSPWRPIRMCDSSLRRRLIPRFLVPLAVWSTVSTAHAEVTAPTLARPQYQARFSVTVFATGLTDPTSMAQLADGSLLVATSQGGPSWLENYLFASQSGALIRLVDADGDGIADGPAEILASGLPGLVSSVRREGNLVFALSSQGSNQAITIWRTGATPAAPFESAGRLSFSFPSSFGHTTYALATRPAPGGGVEVFFNVGAEGNAVSTPADKTAGLAASNGAAFLSGTSFQLAADSVHRVVVTDEGESLTIAALQQIARGLRNAAGMVFDGQGNLWLQDNGIDGTPSNVSLSADELNFLAAAEIGTTIPDFGFASTYIDYATGDVIDPAAGIVQPLVAFRPLAGEKSEGVVELALAPASFPNDFSGGIFAPFSGVFNQGGLANDENPLVFVNTADNSYFHFIENQRLGHPDGVLAAADSLYLSDLNYLGLFGNAIGSIPVVPADQQGVIYRITYVPQPATSTAVLVGLAILLNPGGPWLRSRPSLRRPLND
jgi:glucose/arabinose dehydrogenase